MAGGIFRLVRSAGTPRATAIAIPLYVPWRGGAPHMITHPWRFFFLFQKKKNRSGHLIRIIVGFSVAGGIFRRKKKKTFHQHSCRILRGWGHLPACSLGGCAPCDSNCRRVFISVLQIYESLLRWIDRILISLPGFATEAATKVVVKRGRHHAV